MDIRHFSLPRHLSSEPALLRVLATDVSPRDRAAILAAGAMTSVPVSVRPTDDQGEFSVSASSVCAPKMQVFAQMVSRIGAGEVDAFLDEAPSAKDLKKRAAEL